MGKYKHEGKGRNISVGGGQERKDLFKDMSGGYNAMGDSNSPNYQYNGSAFKQRFSSPMEKQGPLHGNAFGHAMQKTGGDYDKAKSMLEMKGSPMHKSPYKVIGDPNKKMDRLSAKHKSLYDRFEMGQTSEKEEQRMFRLEDRMDKVGKKIESKKAPLNQGVKQGGRDKKGEPKPTSKKFPKGDIRNRPGTKGPKDTRRSVEASAEAPPIKAKEKEPKTMKERMAEGKAKADAKKKSPLNNKENRAEVKAAKEGKSGKEKRQAAREVRKQQRKEGKRGIKKTIKQVEKTVAKVKDSKVYKVGKGIADTVANVKSGRIGAAIESGKKTIADAKKKKSDSPAAMKKSPLYQAKTMGKPPKAKTLTKSIVVPKQKKKKKIQMKLKQEKLEEIEPQQRFQNLKNLPKAVKEVYIPLKMKKSKY